MKNCTWQLSGNRQESNTSLKAMNKVLSHTLRIPDLMAEHSEQRQEEHKELVEALHQLSQVIGVQGPAVLEWGRFPGACSPPAPVYGTSGYAALPA